MLWHLAKIIDIACSIGYDVFVEWANIIRDCFPCHGLTTLFMALSLYQLWRSTEKCSILIAEEEALYTAILYDLAE